MSKLETGYLETGFNTKGIYLEDKSKSMLWVVDLSNLPEKSVYGLMECPIRRMTAADFDDMETYDKKYRYQMQNHITLKRTILDGIRKRIEEFKRWFRHFA